MNLNKVIIIGRLTADPVLRSTANGQAVSSFSVATNRYWTSKNGEKGEETEFHNVVVWGRQAEVVTQFVHKGDMIMVEGRLKTRTWQGKDGQNRRTTEIIAERVQFGPKRNPAGVSGQTAAVAPDPQPQPTAAVEEIPEIDIEASGDIDINDIPF